VSDASLECARSALSQGDVLVAYDEAMEVLEVRPDDREAQFVAALALARSGATGRASILAAALVGRLAEENAPVSLREDAEALVARIAKDEALGSDGPRQSALLRRAAELYERAAERYGQYYSCINAASLFLLAGDESRAAQLAMTARERVKAAPDAVTGGYWSSATDAEAALILGNLDAARDAIALAASRAGEDFAALAVTRRQLRLVCAARQIDAAILDPLTPPQVLHYCGHRFDAAEGSVQVDDAERHVAQGVQAFLRSRTVGFAYGSLASGADIVVAEALLDAGARLHIVLPFSADEFVPLSVGLPGSVWVTRFHRCRNLAATVAVASDSAYRGCDELFAYGARISMGHALNHAAFLEARVEQLAVWNGLAARGVAGTAHDIAAWARTGYATHIIDVSVSRPIAAAHPASVDSPREVRAILFADFRGFSRLRDEQFPVFLANVFSRLAGVLDEHAGELLWRNTWGDAIAAVFTDVTAAASCALGCLEALDALDFASVGLPADLGLRIGAHAGAVMAITDPIRDELTYWGRELTRAARIEPRTPEGEVYVTDAFAALLALEPDSPFVAEYVGRVTTAKDFETIPMYRLRRK
jgi:class 3 adenylate cyclase